MKFYPAVLLLILLWLTGCEQKASEKRSQNTGPVSVSLIVDFEGQSTDLNFDNVEINGQSSVRELLALASDQQLLTFKDTLYTGMGHLLISINNREPSGSAFWFYCINGRKANKGIDDILLSDGDVIKWTYTDDSDPCD